MIDLMILTEPHATFSVRIVEQGDKHGLNDCLTHNKPEPMIEFYDLAHVDKFGPRGQYRLRF